MPFWGFVLLSFESMMTTSMESIFIVASLCFLTGPVLSNFINALHELATYKEFLRSQVSIFFSKVKDYSYEIKMPDALSFNI